MRKPHASHFLPLVRLLLQEGADPLQKDHFRQSVLSIQSIKVKRFTAHLK